MRRDDYKPTKAGRILDISALAVALLALVGLVLGSLHNPGSDAALAPGRLFVALGIGAVLGGVAAFCGMRTDTQAYTLVLVFFSMVAVSVWGWLL